MLRTLLRLLALTALALLSAGSATALAAHPQPAADISKLAYEPEGHFKAGDPLPSNDACEETLLPLMNGKRFNPSGDYNAFDNNVFEVMCLPFRGAGDESADDPYGNAPAGRTQDPRHGYCSQPGEPNPDAPLQAAAGECPNHPLEYVEYFEATMRDILGDFGVTMHRYEFENPGGGNTRGGRAINPAAVVAGADHPDETVIIGAHFDQTTEGPASAWDSAEGHAQLIRVAKLMADYWRSTGTRPSATVKFIPWDGEESGTLGSLDYTENNIVPEEERKVRGYFNTDPCAGGYPAYRFGNPNDRVALGIQLARTQEIPDEFDAGRVDAFNDRAPQIVEDVFTKIDDTVPVAGGTRRVFVSQADEDAGLGDSDIGGDVRLGSSRPVLFSSDWANFLNKGVPFFNPGPEITGPSDENEPNNPDGLAILHTPNDNLQTLNRYTSPDPTGARFSAGWMKGMEMCANLLAWGMLRGDQGGAQTANTDVLAYYEALPNEAQAKAPVNFDAAGSHQYASVASRSLVDGSQLSYSWDFGDGSSGSGREVQHAYAEPGVYTSRLTVRNTTTGQSDTMTVPITVVGPDLAGPTMGDLPAEDADGAFDLRWGFDETARKGFRRYQVEEAADLRTAFDDAADDLPLRWQASEPTEPSIQPWQHSDEADSVRGNVRHRGPRSFYTGVSRDDQRPGVGPNSGVSKLTLKSSVPLAEDAELTYWSSYANDLNDRARVEAAVDDGGPLEWKVVDRVTTTNFFNVPTDELTYPSEMEQRRVDLSRFAGERVRLRFVYAFGASQYVNVFRTGWYVDDIRVDTGTFRSIGEPPEKGMSVSGRSAGTYSYRVRALYDDVASRASAPETIRVTAPASAASSDTTATGSGTRAPIAPRCAVSSGFRSVQVAPRGRGLRFAFARRIARPVTVEVFRQSDGRRILGNRRVARFRGRTRSFTWSGTGARAGAYFVRLAMKLPGGRSDVRRLALARTGDRFRLRRSFYRRESCGVLESYKLGATVFGGRQNRPMDIAFRLTRRATVTVQVLRGRRVVRTFRGETREARITHRLRLASEGLRRGEYTIRITVEYGGKRLTSALGARRL